MIPAPWTFALLTLAAFRVWKLIGDDAILDRPRDAALERLGDLGDKALYLITCPWCAGTYVTAAWWGAWLIWPHGTLVAAGFVALCAAVGYLGVAIDRLEA